MVDVQRVGQQLGIGDGVRARVARRHEHPVHPLGAERVDSDGGHQRRVDPTREADHHLAEAVLGHVVAGAEHQGLVDLALGTQQRRGVRHQRRLDRRVRRGRARRGPSGRDLHHREGPGGRQRSGRYLDVDHEAGLDVLRGSRQHRSVGRHHQRGPVEDELVLPAHEVDVRQRAPRLGRALGQGALAQLHLPGVVRGGVQVDHQLRATPAGGGHRAVGNPGVLADGDAHPHAADVVQVGGAPALAEVAALVEHLVVGQLALVVRAGDPTPGADRGPVAQLTVDPVDEADHGRRAPGGSRHPLERLEVVVHEAGLQQQVLGRVAGDRQLGEGHEVAVRGLGLLDGTDQALDVAVEVADHQVELGQGHSHTSHGVSLREARAGIAAPRHAPRGFSAGHVPPDP